MTAICRISVLLGALVLATGLAGCTPEEPLAAWDASAELKPDLIALQPAAARPGDLVSVSFPDGRMRGVHYVLESRHGDQWNLEYHLTSDWQGSRQPTAHRATELPFEIEAIGFDGPEPDVVSVPVDASAGDYRVCTGNSRPNICAELKIEES